MKFPCPLKNQMLLFLFSKKGNSVSANNYSPISILNTLSRIFEFVIHEHVSHYLKSIFDLCQHGFNKSEFNAAICLSYLDFIPLLVYSKGQVYAICFDWRLVSGLVLHVVLLRILNDCGLFAGYISWFCSYWTDRMFHACYCGGLSSPYELLPGMPQEAVLGPLLFRILINDLCGVVGYSDCLLFVDGIETFIGIKSHRGSSLHQPEITGVCGWCISNFMKPSVNTTRVISFTRKTSLLGFGCKLCETSILHSPTASKICSWYSDSPWAGWSGD